MKKYLIIGDGDSPHILKWIKELGKYYELYLVSSRSATASIKEFIPQDRIHCFNLKISESGGNFKVLKMVLPLRKIIKEIQPDIVNAHYVTSHGLVAALALSLSKSKIPLVQSAWGSDILLTPYRNPLFKKATRFALNKASLATTDSALVASHIYKMSDTETMSFPFGLDRIPEIEFSEKEPLLFFSNRTLNTNSNIDKAIHFFSKVHAQMPEARMIIANEGSEKETLVLLAKELGISDSVDFVGYISAEEQNEIYKRARYYISILTSDALSVSLLESMSYGCIPILSDLPDNREWVDDGKNGIILSAGSRYDVITDISKSAKKIFDINRKKIEEGAIFPDAIKAYVDKLKMMFFEN